MVYPLVSIISINYNSLDDTLEFLASLKEITYPSVEVIIVDNASRINPEEKVLAAFPDTRVIISEKNLGFAGGNNLGIAVAKGKYVLFLNNDTLVPPSFLEPLVEFMESTPDAGMASPKVVFPDLKTIQYAGAKRVSAYTGRGQRIGLFQTDSGQYDSIYKTDLGHGAALIVPKRVIEEVGPMPEFYFLYYEEHEWCEQVKRRGYNMYYVGTSMVVHKESVSVGGEDSYTKVYFINRNRLLFMMRNSTGLARFFGIVYFIMIATPKNLIQYVIKGKFELAKAILSGLRWNLSMLTKNTLPA